MISSILIFAAILGSIGLAMLLALACTHAAAHADDESDQLSKERVREALRVLRSTRTASGSNYARRVGLAAAREVLAREQLFTTAPPGGIRSGARSAGGPASRRSPLPYR